MVNTLYFQTSSVSYELIDKTLARDNLVEKLGNNQEINAETFVLVQVYLDLNRSLDELYYEKYDNVAVMFASLTDYKLGLEDDAELSDKFVLSILDEVISDFDRVRI